MSDTTMTNRIMQIHLSSWRYFALLTLPPVVLVFNLLYSLESAVLLFLFLVTHYYCWRLWLDERLFLLLNNESDLASFDQGMSHLWSVKQGNPRPLAERWHGACRLFYRAMLATVVLWLASLCTVLYLSLTLVE